MKSTVRTILALMIVGVVHITSAATAQTAAPEQNPKTVELGELGQQVRVSLKVGDTLRLVLRQLPRGFKWQIARNDDAILEATSSESTQPDGQGSVTGIQKMVFTAKSVGQDDLVLNYIRPFERDKPPLRAYTVAVTVGDADPSGAPHRTALPLMMQPAAVIPAGTLLGIYIGQLPCADCRGIDTSIALYDAGSRKTNERYYVQTMRYFGTPKGDVDSVVCGKWELKAFTSNTPDGSIFTLQSNESDSFKAYRRQAALIALDSDGKPIQGPFNTLVLKERPFP